MYRNDEIEVTAEVFGPANIVDLEVHSPALGRTVTVRLLTPRGWRADSDRRWPVLYLLHGGDSGPKCWAECTDIAAKALAADILVVLPEGGRAGFYTHWRRPDRRGTAPDWPRFHLVELRGLVERRYAGGDLRVIAGVSMGGYGALVYAATNPGMFAAVASYSGMAHTTRFGIPSLLRFYLRTVDERLSSMWGGYWTHRGRWASGDPYRLADGLAGIPVYLGAGDGRRVAGDPPVPGDRLLERMVGPTSRDLAKRLAALGRPAVTSFGPGTHDWPSWQREMNRSWPFLLNALEKR